MMGRRVWDWCGRGWVVSEEGTQTWLGEEGFVVILVIFWEKSIERRRGREWGSRATLARKGSCTFIVNYHIRLGWRQGFSLNSHPSSVVTITSEPDAL